LEAGDGSAARTRDLAVSTWQNDRPQPSSDPALRALNLPSSFDIQFYEGSFRLTLTSQLQLNEVMEFMTMYPQLRVVCTGHADVTGDRSANLALSKRRAQAVRLHLLESGVLDTRVVLNYFGEERATNRGALDRRVEVSFFVND
jgi:OOP family OmpA-OmpF porin